MPPRTLFEMISGAAMNAGSSVSILTPGRDGLSREGLYRQVLRTALYLQEQDITSSDAVALVLPNGPEAATAFLSVASCAVSAPLNPEYREPEYAFYLEDLEAKALIVQEGFGAAARQVAANQEIPVIDLRPDPAVAGAFSLRGVDTEPSPPPVAISGSRTLPAFGAPADTALILHTSGTTSRPKMVPLTHGNLCASARNIVETLALSPEDRCLNIMPLFHIHGLMACVLSSVAAGAETVCTPGFNAPLFFDWYDAFRPTWYSAVPTMHQAILTRAAAARDSVAAAPPRFVRSSSASLAPSVMAALEEVFQAPVVEAYGMTEASHQMACNPLPPGKRKPGSVGLAAGPEVAIMDAAGTILPASEIGEVVIKGENVTSGYARNPEANATAFTNGWFRTGDQGYLDEEGYLFLTGRLKEIINRGGEKISPREIDEVLLQHPSVRQATAFALPHPTLGEEVAAAVVLEEGADLTQRQLQEYASVRLTSVKVPRRVVFLDSIPKGPTGKLRRIGLADVLGLTGSSEAGDTPESADAPKRDPKPASGQGEAVTEADAEADYEIVDLIRSIWSESLRAESITPDDDFFGLGGDSILILQIISRVSDELGAEISFLDFIDSPTPRAMAHRIKELLSMTEAGDRTSGKGESSLRKHIPVLARDGGLPASLTQERMLFLEYYELEVAVNNRPLFLRLYGPLDAERLRKSLNSIIKRHEVLRSSIQLTPEGARVRITETVELDLPMTDLGDASSESRTALVKEMSRSAAFQRFNLQDGPLIRGSILRLGPTEHLVLLTTHHAVFDGWSADILVRELAAFYTGSNRLASLPFQYPDYAAWQHRQLESGAWEEHEIFWKSELADQPVLELPTDHLRPRVLSSRGATLETHFPASLRERVLHFSRKERITPFVLLFSIFELLLYRYTGAKEMLIGVPVVGRSSPDADSIIGPFMNMVALRGELSGIPSFVELLQRVQKKSAEVFCHQDLPFEHVVALVNPDRDRTRPPLIQVMFNMERGSEDAVDAGDLRIEREFVDDGASVLELTLELIEKADGYMATYTWSTDLFDEERIHRMAAHYRVLLEAALDTPNASIDHLPLLTGAERDRVLKNWNDTTTAYPRERCVHELFEEVAGGDPGAEAICFQNESRTYGELNERAGLLAGELHRLGVGPEDTVAVCMHRSVEMVVALLAILKAGGAYVPIDPGYPDSRKELMLTDCAVKLVIADSDVASTLPRGSWKVIISNRSGGFEKSNDGGGHELDITKNRVASEATPGPRNLACILYTSGSTGKPKGVMIEHRNIVRLVRNTNLAQFGPGETFLQFAPITFDAAAFEIWGPLLNGSRVAIAPPGRLSLRQLGTWIRESGVSAMNLSAGLFQLMVDERLEDLAGVRQLFAGGDIISASHVRTFLEAFPGNRFINGYGPTEGTSDACAFHVSAEDTIGSTIPIGLPISNTRAYLLDENLNLLPVGVPGELYLGGDGIARGYVNQPERTRERFIPDPFSDEPGDRLYRTGDLCIRRPHGPIEFIGRMDQQVKVQGFRVEPGEIEATLREHPAIRQAAVTIVDHGHASPLNTIVAFVVPVAETRPSPETVAAYLRSRLPEYMLPSRVIFLDAFPITENGEVDREALRILSSAEGSNPESDVGSRVESFVASDPDSPVPGASQGLSTPPSPPGRTETDTEAMIRRIWSERLDIEPPGVHRNFFDLGGNSLAALSVISAIENEIGQSIPIGLLYEVPTVAGLARRIDAGRSHDVSGLLVPMRTDGSRKPLFLLSGQGGHVIGFQLLVQHLGSDQPVYGLQAPGLDAVSVPVYSINEYARMLIPEIQSVQPHGPYRLVGYSYGGRVAFELAHQLQALGETVSILGLVDSHPPFSSAHLPLPRRAVVLAERFTSRLRLEWRRLTQESEQGVSGGWSGLAVRLKRRKGIRAEFTHLQGSIEAKSVDRGSDSGRTKTVSMDRTTVRVQRVNDASFIADRAYKAQPYTGRVLLFEVADRSGPIYYREEFRRWYRWDDLVDDLTIIRIPGSHSSLLEEPEVQELANTLREALNEE